MTRLQGKMAWPDFSRRDFLAASAAGAAAAIARPARAADQVFTAAPGTADATPAARACAAACRGRSGVELALTPGDYHFADPAALRDLEKLMASPPEELVWGGNGKPFSTAFEFYDLDGLVLDGRGANFIFHGLVAPLSFRNCRNVTLKNFTIDWDRPLFTVGRVEAVGPASVVFRPAEGMPLTGREPVFAWQAFDPVTLAYSPFDAYYFTPTPMTPVGGGRVRLFHPSLGRLRKGDGLVIRHTGMFRPGIHLLDCSNVRLEGVTVRHSAGAAVTGHRSTDIAISRLDVTPTEGRVMTVTADALHFISCRGALRVEDSNFAGMGDDGINVHGFYQTVKRRIDDRTLVLTVPARTQDCLLDYPEAGDRLEICRRETAVGYAETEVESAVPSQERWEVTVKFGRPLPAGFRLDDIFANLSQLPRFAYRRNRVRCNRARAVLCQTRGATIEDNEFDHCTGTGVHINTAAGLPFSWWESAGTRDVVIRGNRIVGCGYGPGCYHGASGVIVGAETLRDDPGVHRNLVVEQNHIECVPGRAGVYLGCVTGARLAGNEIIGGKPATVVGKSVRDLQRD